MSPTQARTLLGGAVATVATLHVLSGRIALPLFHPPDPIPEGELFARITIQAILLIAVGALMARIAESVHASREALAADLERRRELHRLKDVFLATASTFAFGAD